MTWQWLAMLGVAAIAALMFRRYVGFVTRAQAHSMWPTLRPGLFLFTRSIVHRGQIRHGDIAVVQSAELGRYILKRVVGLPGDRLVFGPSGLVRNGIGVAEPYVSRASGTSGSWLVPEGHCFLLGDNRAASCDSRSWTQPFAPLDRVVGRVRAPNASRQTEARLTAISARSVHTSAWGWIHVLIGVLLAAIGVGNDHRRDVGAVRNE